MKRSKFLLLSLLIASIGLVSCNSNNNGSIETEVYFYLNGGQCNEKDTEYHHTICGRGLLRSTSSSLSM